MCTSTVPSIISTSTILGPNMKLQHGSNYQSSKMFKISETSCDVFWENFIDLVEGFIVPFFRKLKHGTSQPDASWRRPKIPRDSDKQREEPKLAKASVQSSKKEVNGTNGRPLQNQIGLMGRTFTVFTSPPSVPQSHCKLVSSEIVLFGRHVQPI